MTWQPRVCRHRAGPVILVLVSPPPQVTRVCSPFACSIRGSYSRSALSTYMDVFNILVGEIKDRTERKQKEKLGKGIEKRAHTALHLDVIAQADPY